MFGAVNLFGTCRPSSEPDSDRKDIDGGCIVGASLNLQAIGIQEPEAGPAVKLTRRPSVLRSVPPIGD